MGVNPVQDVLVFPVAKTSTSVSKSSFSRTLEHQKENRLSKGSRDGLSRPEKHPTRFDKGSLLDLYA
jgi:hypothetical protein